MTGLKYFPTDKLDKIRFILTDIDGTLTDSGKFTAQAYTALWDLKNAGYTIIPITGGGAGTAVYAIQAWPIDAIITESGALSYCWQGGAIREFVHPEAARYLKSGLRKSMLQEMEDNVPGFKLARDQFARRFDIAVDYHETEPYFTEKQVREVYLVAEKYGARVRRSSIHLNVFFGDYDKLAAVEVLLADVYGLKSESLAETCIYVGDAPNDEEMFRFFPLSVGVKNVLDYGDKLKFKPKYVTDGHSGEGFSELADMLLNRRK